MFRAFRFTEQSFGVLGAELKGGTVNELNLARKGKKENKIEYRCRHHRPI